MPKYSGFVAITADVVIAAAVAVVVIVAVAAAVVVRGQTGHIHTSQHFGAKLATYICDNTSGPKLTTFVTILRGQSSHIHV